MLVLTLAPWGSGGATAAQERAASDRAVAVLAFQMIDSSLEGEMRGENPDEQARLDRLAPDLREAIATTPGFEVIDAAPVAEEAADQSLGSCESCAVGLGEELGADIVVVGTVQKVSNLILNINGYAYEVGSGEPIARGSADIRSNTDKSWQRGIDYLWDNVLRAQFEALE